MSVKSYIYKKLKSRKFWKRLIFTIVFLPIILVTVLIAILYWKQDAVVQKLIADMNKDFRGRIEIKDSHISPFANFPYISIDLEQVKIYEGKEKNAKIIADVNDVYLGFDIWTIISGKMEIKELNLSNGKLKLVQHKDGEFNITRALSSAKPVKNVNEESQHPFWERLMAWV